MTESLERFTAWISRSETATDVVAPSLLQRFAATLGLPTPPLEPGAPVPPGWHGGLFPPTHRPGEMRPDGQAAGGGIVPPIPLPRRRIGGLRTSFLAPLRVGDTVTRTVEIADLRVDDGPSGAMVVILERSSLVTDRGPCVVEEREMRLLSEERALAESPAAPAIPGGAIWHETIEPTTPLLFRFSAIRFNSHRIHYDRDYVTTVERLPGLVVQSTLISQLLLELCRREAADRQVVQFEAANLRSVYDLGPFTLAGRPDTDDPDAATFWALDQEGRLAMLATARLAPLG